MQKRMRLKDAAKEFSKLGASKGGEARALSLTPEERSAIARNAVMKRWEKTIDEKRKIPKVEYGSPDRPLIIGGEKIPCYVLDDGTRILRERSVATALGRKGGGAHWQKKKSAEKSALLPEYLSLKNLDPYITEDMRESLLNPITYRLKSGSIAQGIPAKLLTDICNIWLTAREKGALTKSQLITAYKAELLMRGFAQVGIIALVDEVTGYQEARTKHALQEILEKFIAKELRPWIKTFPDDFYKEIFRLNNWEFKTSSVKRPGVIGTWTNDIVYNRLAPGVRDELHRLAERDEKGRAKHKLFQRLTEGTGHPKLREHLAAVTALMKAATNWKDFKHLLQRALPAYGSNLQIPYQD
ncbi:MAG: P63C domain-containing protein [Nitrospirae bacterium]|nr:P63C domain-containing protein [Nitrospirota bacterium]